MVELDPWRPTSHLLPPPGAESGLAGLTKIHIWTPVTDAAAAAAAAAYKGREVRLLSVCHCTQTCIYTFSAPRGNAGLSCAQAASRPNPDQPYSAIDPLKSFAILGVSWQGDVVDWTVI